MLRPVEALEEKLQYRFVNAQTLVRALTHRSWLSERGSPLPEDGDNEQLEFLGDSVLGFVVSESLVRRFPDGNEGKLSELKAQLVSASHLYTCALTLDLGKFLQLGKGEERNGGRTRRTVLANAMEAVIAAIHLDGGIDAARAFVNHSVLSTLDRPAEMQAIGSLNHKSLLQERAQELGLPVPRYATVLAAGPEHAKLYTVEARVNQELFSRATASSKKAASQIAAGRLLELMNLQNSPDESPAADALHS